MNQPSHRDRAELCLRRADSISSSDPARSAALAARATAHAVLARLDVLSPGDQARGVVPGVPVARVDHETAPAIKDTGERVRPATGELRAGLVELIRDADAAHYGGPQHDPAGRPAEYQHLADAILAAGWRPPTPRVFFPGDTVPAGVPVENNYGDLIKGKSDAWVAQPGAVYVELPRPSSAEWQAAVDRAHAEREQSTPEPSSRRRAHVCAAVSLSGFPCTHPGDHDGPHRAVFPGGAFTFHDANACRTPGGFPYRQHPHDLCGSNADRQSVGDPGHCEDCCSVGHVVAHPDLGCGDVGCYRTHGDEEANRD